jgi:hypothetical protein
MARSMALRSAMNYENAEPLKNGMAEVKAKNPKQAFAIKMAEAKKKGK